MTWIKVRTNLDTDPRVIAMAGELSVSELHVVGMLWKVWSWADAHSVDGNALCVTDVTLDRFTGVTGFAQALRNVRWLVTEDGTLTFPNFREHNGETAKKRAQTAKRVSKHRNADVTLDALPEKRREEKKPDTGGAGVLKSGSGAGSEKSPSVFAKLTVDDLADDAVLEDWFQFASVRARRPLFANSDTNRLNVFAAAERAIEVGDEPLKLFRHIVGKQQWDLITSEQEERARKRILRLRRSS